MSTYDNFREYQRQLNVLQEQLNNIARVDRIPMLDENDFASDSDRSTATQQSIKAYVDENGGGSGGWIEVSGWSYASASSITVPSGAASIYAVGDQVRLKQGGGYKWFSIIAIADTTLAVTGGTDYTVANAAITDAAFSKGGGAGHPGWYNYTPTITFSGGSIDPTSITTGFSFSVIGRTLNVWGTGVLTWGSGNRNTTIFSLPISISKDAAISAAASYATLLWTYTRVSNSTNTIILYHSSMSQNGYYWLTVAALI